MANSSPRRPSCRPRRPARRALERDRHRFGGTREAGFVYHHAKRFVVPCVAAAWLFYLARPASVHPDLVIWPAAGSSGYIDLAKLSSKANGC